MHVSDAEESRNVNGASENGGVLTNLPRARPQRASARRLAERNGASARNGTSKTAVKRPPKKVAKAPSEPAAKPSTRATPVPAEPELSAKPLPRGSVKPVGESAASTTAKASRGGRASAARPAGGTARGTSSRRAAPKRARPAPVQEPAPRQGFECESETPMGSVQPPGGAELIASAAELVGELAKAGVSSGERLLKDVLSRLPL